MYRKLIAIALSCSVLIASSTYSFAVDLGNTPPNIPRVVSVTLSTTSHIEGNSEEVNIAVVTANVPNATLITGDLVKNDGSTLVEGVTTANSTVTNDAVNLKLSIPPGIEAGSYKIKVTLASLNVSHASTSYTINPVAQDSSAQVDLSLTSTTNTDDSEESNSSSNNTSTTHNITSVSTTGAVLVEGEISGNFTVNGTSFSAIAGNNMLKLVKGGVKTQITSFVSASTTQLTAAIPTDLTAGTYTVELTINGVAVTHAGFSISSPSTPTPPAGPGAGAGAGAGAVAPVPPASQTLTQTYTPTVGANGTASVSVDAAIVDQLLTSAKDTATAGKTPVIEFLVKPTSASGTAPSGVLSQVSLQIPSDSFAKIAEESSAKVTVGIGLAILTFDQTAVDAIAGNAESGTGTAGNVTISVEKVDVGTLSEKAQATIGSHPVYSFNVTAGGKAVEKFNVGSAAGSVAVSIPYTLQSGENQNAIVVYYIDSQGTLKTVRGAYDTASKMVKFSTSHFSNYAIGHNLISFKDVPAGYWYSNPVAFIAARGITTGSGDGYYSLNSRLTRAQFIVMMMRAYGIEPSGTNSGSEAGSGGVIANFPDAGNAYYTAYLAEAKQLGISKGDESCRCQTQNTTRLIER